MPKLIVSAFRPHCLHTPSPETIIGLTSADISADADVKEQKANPSDRETEIIEMITEVMRRNASRLKKHKVFLFGSRAAGNAGKRSDFDIGVFGEKPLPVEDYYAIEDQLEALPTLHRIDWVDFNRVSERFRRRAMRHIKVLYERSLDS